jgi:hypothetical protein
LRARDRRGRPIRAKNDRLDDDSSTDAEADDGLDTVAGAGVFAALLSADLFVG